MIVSLCHQRVGGVDHVAEAEGAEELDLLRLFLLEVGVEPPEIDIRRVDVEREADPVWQDDQGDGRNTALMREGGIWCARQRQAGGDNHERNYAK